MVYSQYCEYIYDYINSELQKEINVSIDDLRALYEKKLIKLIIIKPKQTFVYKIVELYEKGLCELTDCKWDDKRDFFCCSRKPVLHYDNLDFKNYGDLMAYDGSHRFLINNYSIEIKVKDSSIWYFKFDENNEESKKAFFEYFEPFLYREFIKLVIEQRIEEIHNEEKKKLLNIVNKLIKK